MLDAAELFRSSVVAANRGGRRIISACRLQLHLIPVLPTLAANLNALTRDCASGSTSKSGTRRPMRPHQEHRCRLPCIYPAGIKSAPANLNHLGRFLSGGRKPSAADTWRPKIYD